MSHHTFLSLITLHLAAQRFWAHTKIRKLNFWFVPEQVCCKIKKFFVVISLFTEKFSYNKLDILFDSLQLQQCYKEIFHTWFLIRSQVKNVNINLPLGPYFAWYCLIWSLVNPSSWFVLKYLRTSSTDFAWASSMIFFYLYVCDRLKSKDAILLKTKHREKILILIIEHKKNFNFNFRNNFSVSGFFHLCLHFFHPILNLLIRKVYLCRLHEI